MNSFSVVLAALLAVAAAETFIQKNHPSGAWEYHLTSDGNQFYQKPIAIALQPQQSFLQADEIPTLAPRPFIALQPQHVFLQADEISTPAPRPFIPILSQSEIHHPDGAYQRAYKSADGTALNERGNLKRNFENDGNVVVKSGQYNYIAPDGTPIALTWVADEFGYRATGAHLPQTPTAQ